MRAYGVFIDGIWTAGRPPTYSVVLIGTDGKTAAEVHPTFPAAFRYSSEPPSPPLVSISDSRVYYTDGASIKYVTPDGSTGVAAPYPGGPQTAAGFAVSPDDRRIAIALLTFQSPEHFQSMDLYVEDLGGGNRVELFSSTIYSEWPVAWSNGHLVVAVGEALAGYGSNIPYSNVRGYHIVDASTGNRLVQMRDDCIFGSLQRTGTACWNNRDGGGVGTFDGSYRPYPLGGGTRPSFIALSPDGLRLMENARPDLYFRLLDSRGGIVPVRRQGTPMGWIDDQHIVYYGLNGSDRYIVDLNSQSATPIESCFCNDAGVFFGALSLPA